MAYKRISPQPVIEGGTGIIAAGAGYAPICAGTTTTGAFQTASTGISTAGYVLTSNGNAALPSFKLAPGASGFVLLQTVNISGSPTYITFDNTIITSTYDIYFITFSDLVWNSTNMTSPDMYMLYSTNNGSTYYNSATNYQSYYNTLAYPGTMSSNTTADIWALIGTTGSQASTNSRPLSGYAWLMGIRNNISSTSAQCIVLQSFHPATVGTQGISTFPYNNVTYPNTPINNIMISSLNVGGIVTYLVSGTISIYGVV